MIDAVGGSPGAAPDSLLAGSAALQQDDFLRLLVTQLQNQDPLDPLDAQDFASQLAEFTAMEQQILTNQLLEAQIQMSSSTMVESQNSVAIGLIGSGIISEGDQVELSGTADDAVFIATNGPVAVRVNVLDENGEIVLAIDRSLTGSGVQRVPLGADAEELAAGGYTLSVEVLGGAEGASARPLSSGTVRGIRWGDSGPVLVVGSEEIALANVLEVTT
jgi:flagellar basal-body rod modification protein FlgD